MCLENVMTWKKQSEILEVLIQTMCKYDWYNIRSINLWSINLVVLIM